jgi:hypothetical protein
VERESTKHSPREDEDLARSVEGLVKGAPVDPRSEEWRSLEDPGDDVTIDPANRPGFGEPGEFQPADAMARTELAIALTGLSYPATTTEIAQVAEGNDASPQLVQRLRELPHGRFDLHEAIWEALGGPPDDPER